MRSRIGLGRNERGSTMVEFALAAVIFLTIVFFIIEFGTATWRSNTIASLAKDGARFASVHGATSGSVADSAMVQNYVNGRAGGMTLVVRTSWPDASSKAAGNRVQVRVEGTYLPRSRLLPGGALSLRSTAQVVIAR